MARLEEIEDVDAPKPRSKSTPKTPAVEVNEKNYKEWKKKQQRPLLLTAYLFAYNALSALLWLYPLMVTILHLAGYTKPVASTEAEAAAGGLFARHFIPSYTEDISISFKYGPKNPIGAYYWAPAFLRPLLKRAETTYFVIGEDVKWVQTIACLEILHSLLGWVRSPLTTTLMQVFSRIVLVWGIAPHHVAAQANPIYTSMLLSWGVTEVVRYSFYALNVLGFEPYWLLYIRYTLFYVLYPTGAGSEAFLMFATLPVTRVPLSYNFHLWKLGDYIRFILYCGWWPSLYFLYTHMMKQRKKVLMKGNVQKAVKAE